MRKVLLIVFVLFQSVAFTQNVPAKVQAVFKKKFPNAEEASWMTSASSYEVNFHENEEYKSAKFDKTGIWTETRYSIPEDELPVAVVEAINKKYSDSYTEDVVKVETLEEIIYELRVVTNDDSTYPIHISMDGKILKNISFSNIDDEDGNED